MKPCVIGCGQQSQEPLCTDCWSRLEAALRSVTWLTPELRTTINRQSTSGLPLGIVSRSADTPMPINIEAVIRQDRLHDLLAAWMRCLWDDFGTGPIERLTSASALAKWLISHGAWCRQHPAALDLYDEITTAVRSCAQIVDRRPDRIYLAPCGAELNDSGSVLCAADLYGVEGQVIVRCRECGTRWNLQERRAWMLDQVQERTANSVQLSDLLASLGVEVASSTIRTWCGAGKLEARGRDRRGRPVYRVGDVMELLASRRKRPVAA